MAFTKNLAVFAAIFTLMALLLPAGAFASTSSYALCKQRTGVMCTSDAMCVTLCLHKNGGYTGGYCSTEFVVGDPSCVCTKPSC
ncbi:hypothetical protein HU200_063673 [Digitaria exilis]|uniref:Defensin n=1 Tax=Digitaria exilis TaxID=1010633 RepID=A0A835A6X9_9POAL|nr:hypothetical protein HU200_063673 [Digitaria exilis]